MDKKSKLRMPSSTIDKPMKKTAKSSEDIDVYQTVRDMAISFHFKPGERINEGKLATYLGVSRTPLREAMQKLVSDKLLRWERNKGFFCHMLDEKEVFDLYEFRKIIEQQATFLAAERASDEELQALKAAAIEYSKLGDDTPKEVLLDFDQKLHQQLVMLSGNQELAEALKKVNQRIYFIRWVNLTDRPTGNDSEHIHIIEALIARDGLKAMTIMGNHVEKRKEQIANYIREGYGHIYTGNTPKII